MARRLLTGSLDRAVDVAATLELRGYSLERPSRSRRTPEHLYDLRVKQVFRRQSRFDRRFYATGALVLIAAIAGKPLGADGFHAYPTIGVEANAATFGLALVVVLSGFAPISRRARGARRA
jgi:hypothetical protein